MLVKGNGFVKAQSIPPGEGLSSDEVLILEFTTYVPPAPAPTEEQQTPVENGP